MPQGKRPARGIEFQIYITAWNRLFRGSYVPISELIAYYDNIHIPHSLEVFIDTFQQMEADQLASSKPTTETEEPTK